MVSRKAGRPLLLLSLSWALMANRHLLPVEG